MSAQKQRLNKTSFACPRAATTISVVFKFLGSQGTWLGLQNEFTTKEARLKLLSALLGEDYILRIPARQQYAVRSRHLDLTTIGTGKYAYDDTMSESNLGQ
jgi:hypothetical protein